MRLVSALLALVATASARFVIYADEWHPSFPTKPADKAGIDYVIVAFAFANNVANFNASAVSAYRSEFPDAKILVAVGGWGGNGNAFMTMSQSEAGIQQFAADIQGLVQRTGADGIDLDWEYPGGNGEDFPKVPNEKHAHEIKAFPKVVKAIRNAIGTEKTLSLAVPGKKVDMLAYTEHNGPLLEQQVDFINVMSYDLMNRRDKVTDHHTSLNGSRDAIDNYLAIGFPASKINLGFAFYAKYFTLPKGSSCSNDAPLGCAIVPAENAEGKDALTSGAFTFEKSNLADIPSNIGLSTNGQCGLEKGKCSSGCCSQYGNCGSSLEHCGNGCQFAFGTGCTGSDIRSSFQMALANVKTDDEAGAAYYIDTESGLFWTWDTPELIHRKFEKIVREKQIGGVMAWSLGEDSFDWRHVRLIAEEAGKGGYQAAHNQYPAGEVGGEQYTVEEPIASEEGLENSSAGNSTTWEGPTSEDITQEASLLEEAYPSQLVTTPKQQGHQQGTKPTAQLSATHTSNHYDGDEELVCTHRKKRAFSA